MSIITRNQITIIEVSDGEPGPQGPPGTDGVDGQDGESLYTWTAYADDEYGNGISGSPTGKGFIGYAYNKATPTPSGNPSDYTWSPFFMDLVAKALKLTDNGQIYTDDGKIIIRADGHAEFRDVSITGAVNAETGVFKGDIDIKDVLKVIRDPGALLQWGADAYTASELLSRDVGGNPIQGFLGQSINYAVSGTCGYRAPSGLANVGSTIDYHRIEWFSSLTAVRVTVSSGTLTFYKTTDAGTTWSTVGSYSINDTIPYYDAEDMKWYYVYNNGICSTDWDGSGNTLFHQYGDESNPVTLHSRTTIWSDGAYVYAVGKNTSISWRMLTIYKDTGDVRRFGGEDTSIPTLGSPLYVIYGNHFFDSAGWSLYKSGEQWYLQQWYEDSVKTPEACSLTGLIESRIYAKSRTANHVIAEKTDGKLYDVDVSRYWDVTYNRIDEVSPVQGTKYYLEDMGDSAYRVSPFPGAYEKYDGTVSGIICRIAKNGNDVYLWERSPGSTIQVKKITETTTSSFTATKFLWHKAGSGTSERLIIRLNDSHTTWGCFFMSETVPIAGDMTASGMAKLYAAFDGNGTGKLQNFAEGSFDSLTVSGSAEGLLERDILWDGNISSESTITLNSGKTFSQYMYIVFKVNLVNSDRSYMVIPTFSLDDGTNNMIYFSTKDTTRYVKFRWVSDTQFYVYFYGDGAMRTVYGLGRRSDVG